MKKGYTLIELILVLAILVVVMMTAAPFLRATYITWESDKELNTILQNTRYALSRISDEIKYSNEIIAIDANYIRFGTYLEETYLDDRNAGHTQTGTWISGALQGGYAGDYLISNTPGSTSSWRFNIICEGEYDIYIWHVATSANSTSVGYAIYDDGFNVANYTVNQQINGSRWYKLGTVNFTAGGHDYLQMSTPASGFAVADGVKLVYKGYDHKEINFVKNDPTPLPYDESHKIFFRAASKTNAEINLLIDNVYQPKEGTPQETPIFQYFQMDGVTPATSPRDVALIKISFEIRDPQNRVAPYFLTTSIYRNISPAQRRLVINEINFQPPERRIAFDNAEGRINSMDGNFFGWSTAYEDGWLSMFDNFSDGDLTGWTSGGSGTWTNIDGGGGNRVLRGIGSNTLGSRNTFAENSYNYTYEIRFWYQASGSNSATGAPCSTAVPCQSPYFGFYLRYIDANNWLRVDTYRSGASSYLRIVKRQGGTYTTLSSTVIPHIILGTWNTLRIDDYYGRVDVWLNDVKRYSGVLYNSGGQTVTFLGGTKGVFIWDDDTIYFDDVKITSYSFKPIAYLTDFEGEVIAWRRGRIDTTRAEAIWEWGTPQNVGPPSCRSGEKCIGTNILANYNNNADENAFHRPTYLLSRYDFQSLYFWAWFETAQDGDAYLVGRGDDITWSWQLTEAKIFPMYNLNYNDNPTIFDGTTTVFSGAGSTRAWTANHTGWQQLRGDISMAAGDTDYTSHFRFASNLTSSAAGLYIDDVEIYPGGIWGWGPRAAAAEPLAYSGTYYYGTALRNDGINPPDYPNYAHCALETPTVVIPDYAQVVTLRWYQWRDFEGTATDYDGAVVKYSSDKGQTWVKFEDVSPGWDGPINTNYSNELGGEEAWTYDDRNWREVKVKIEDVNIGGKKLRFRFEFASDSTTDAVGWYIDNIEVIISPTTYYDWIEIYNPTPYPVDLQNYRLVFEDSFGDTPVQYDTIGPDTTFGNLTTLAPYGYAIITTQNTLVYTIPASFPPYSSSALRLKIDDDKFGYYGLQNDYGIIKLKTPDDKLVDCVPYNLVFYDDAERPPTSADGYPYDTYSETNFGNQNAQFRWLSPAARAGGTDIDKTRGQFNLTPTGRCFLIYEPSSGRQEEYGDTGRCDLRLPALNFRNSTSVNPPYLKFSYFLRNSRYRRDGFIIQASTSGGSNFTESDFTEQIARERLFPTYEATINDASNILNTRWAFCRDTRTWREIEVNLQDYVSQIIMLRFYFGAGADYSVGGVYIDNIAAYYDWGRINSTWDGQASYLPYTLERYIFSNDSREPLSWGRSNTLYGTPARKNSITPQ